MSQQIRWGLALSEDMELEETGFHQQDGVIDELIADASGFWDWFTGTPLQIILILVIGGCVLVVVRRAITLITRHLAEAINSEDAQRRALRARTVGSVLRSAANIIISAVLIVLLLNALGQAQTVTYLLSTAGVLGVALGFGAQSLVRDFLSGIFLIIEDQFGVGDEVDLGMGAVGTVERVDLRLTHLRAFDGTLWHVRNGEILRAGNHTQQWSRAVAKITVPVGSDVKAVRAALQKAVDKVMADADHTDSILDTVEVRGVDSVDDGVYTFTLHGRVQPGTDGEVSRALLGRAREELIKAGILGDWPWPTHGPGTTP